MKLPLFFDRRMVAESGGVSPSAGKPAAFATDLADRGMSHAVELFEVAPATVGQLEHAHDVGYVRAVLTGRAANGFGNQRRDVALSLPWTSGAMLSAARHALAHPGDPAACAPVSGFHHACYASGGGFCTFNGLMVAAAALLTEGLAATVGVLDCDTHYGDGTDDVLRRAGPWTRAVTHVTFGRTHFAREHAAEFLARDLPAAVERVGRCDVVLYQAGADPHVDDPLGGWLTTEELAERDRVVFEELRAARGGRGTPCAWDLAGGYQRDADGGIRKVLEIHRNTARAALRAAG